MSKQNNRETIAEGASQPRNVAKASGQVNDPPPALNRKDMVRANNALSDISEISLRGRALLDIITGGGFEYFASLTEELQQSLLHQAFLLVAEINDIAAAALDAQDGGQA